ncbi:hypothetical protein PQR52_36830 [Paraburkholderia aspalathi]|uniref:hypothetical protein n=1 Tax=Paraburkholderia aspalathi TaxID=1324617 RepID=UPI0038B81021
MNSYAQVSGMDRDAIQTTAGVVSISKVGKARADGVTFNVTFEGAHFDQLYGSRYGYFTDGDTTHNPAGRIIIEDFVGGFSEPPSVSMYDFRKQPPVVLSISNALDLDEVSWTGDNVFLSAAGKWYVFAHDRLSHSKPPQRTAP